MTVQPPSQCCITNKMPRQNMWECSWRFRSSGRVDVLPDKCLLMLWGHTHSMT